MYNGTTDDFLKGVLGMEQGNKKIVFRPHRGGLAESLNETKEFYSREEMIEYVRYGILPGALNGVSIEITEPQGDDDRIGWKDWCYVKYKFAKEWHVLGYYAEI